MYGAGTYKLTFKVRADSARTNALRVKTTLKNNDRFTYKNISVTNDWTVFEYTFDLTAEQMGDWAAAMGIEAVYIDKDTKIRDFKRDLMLGEVFFK